MGKYDGLSTEEYYNLPLFDKIKDNLFPEDQGYNHEELDNIFGPSGEEFFNQYGDFVKPYMEDVNTIIGELGDLVDGDKAMLQNAYLQHLANQFTDSQRIATEKYNSEEAKKAFDRQWFLQQAAQKFNAEQAELTHIRNLEASNTAYQRQVADMKEAGLNPYLAYSQGGAPMTSSQSASVGVNNVHSASLNAVQGKSNSVNNSNAISGIISTIASTALGLAKLLK